MKWRELIASAPIWLLLLVMTSQIYNMVTEFVQSPFPVVISTYTIDFNKCSLGLPRVGATLALGLRKYGSPVAVQDVIVSKLPGEGLLRITMQLKDPSPAAFDEETRLLKTLVYCSSGQRCQGKPSTGDNLGTADCEIAQSEFRPHTWEISKLARYRVGAIAVVALLIDAAALYYLLRRPKNSRSG